jgi:UDP-N-acetylmuramate dehydrogenase
MSHPDLTKSLSELTTMGVGGSAERMLVAQTREELVSFASELTSSQETWCVLAGGSNSIFPDSGFAGTVLLVRTTGIEQVSMPHAEPDSVFLRVEAGHDWDDLVAFAVDRGLSGIEALSGIPGSTGAAPMQNIGAYGQELSSVLHSVEFFDTETGAIEEVRAFEMELGYRTSVFKRDRCGVIVSVLLELRGVSGKQSEEVTMTGAAALSQPIRYPQLAAALAIELGERVSLGRVRDTVLSLRRSKGMVYDPSDPDSHSSGSFFINPVVTESIANLLPDDAPRWPVGEFEGQHTVKLSAAWLIELSGIERGFSLPGSNAAISHKHALAITNQGEATAEQVAELARYIRIRVQSDTGIELHPEPILYELEI